MTDITDVKCCKYFLLKCTILNTLKPFISTIVPGSLLFVIIYLYCCIMRHSECHNSGFVSSKATSGFSLFYKVNDQRRYSNNSNYHQALAYLALLSGQMVDILRKIKVCLLKDLFNIRLWAWVFSEGIVNKV